MNYSENAKILRGRLKAISKSNIPQTRPDAVTLELGCTVYDLILQLLQMGDLDQTISVKSGKITLDRNMYGELMIKSENLQLPVPEFLKYTCGCSDCCDCEDDDTDNDEDEDEDDAETVHENPLVRLFGNLKMVGPIAVVKVPKPGDEASDEESENSSDEDKIDGNENCCVNCEAESGGCESGPVAESDDCSDRVRTDCVEKTKQ